MSATQNSAYNALKNASKNALNTSKNVLNNASKNTGKTATAVEGIMVKNTTDTAIVVLVILVMVVIVMILVYIIRVFKTNALKRVDLLNKIVTLDSRSSLPYSVPAGRMAVTTRGQEFTYSFWLYLSENYKASDSHKLLLMRGNTSNSFTDVDATSNPVVMMDGKSNTLYFALSTTATPAGAAYNLNCIARSPGTSCSLSGATNHLVTKVDYVPLQRWVLFSFVVRDNSATLFVDGDVYSIVTTNDIKLAINQPRPLIRGTAGDAIIGDPNFPVNGFMSKLEFYNYALSQKQIQTIYKNGPVNSGLLGKMGISNYGVRSPIYNLEDV